MSLNKGHPIMAIPGPTVVPERVLNAMHRPSANIYEGELVEMTDHLLEQLKKVVRTEGYAAIYLANGHGAWEAAIKNTLNEGDKIVVLSNGFFAHKWGEVAATHKFEVEYIDYGMTSDADAARLEDVLRAYTDGQIKAVLAVQSETSSSVRNDIPSLRAAIDTAGHAALFMVDCIASLGCDQFEMDAWGVDVAVSAGQKGMMNPIGLSFVFFNEKADAARTHANPDQYWDWTDRAKSKFFVSALVW
ncbi:MAG: aminotransferase class V-fold PLP-dependent enzyme [Paracoccaceae bacterium]|nr:aminotransferase class V-fold PLP-dependent enzyme [Paracoccaceae bacterium]